MQSKFNTYFPISLTILYTLIPVFTGNYRVGALFIFSGVGLFVLTFQVISLLQQRKDPERTVTLISHLEGHHILLFAMLVPYTLMPLIIEQYDAGSLVFFSGFGALLLLIYGYRFYRAYKEPPHTEEPEPLPPADTEPPEPSRFELAIAPYISVFGGISRLIWIVLFAWLLSDLIDAPDLFDLPFGAWTLSAIFWNLLAFLVYFVAVVWVMNPPVSTDGRSAYGSWAWSGVFLVAIIVWRFSSLLSAL